MGWTQKATLLVIALAEMAFIGAECAIWLKEGPLSAPAIAIDVVAAAFDIFCLFVFRDEGAKSMFGRALELLRGEFKALVKALD